MRRKGIIATLAAVMVLMSSVFCFADGNNLKLLESYPKDGQKNTSIENVGVKMYFDGTFKEESTRKANDKAIKIVDSKGKAIDTETMYSDSEDGMVLVVATSGKASAVSASEEYTLVIKPGFVDDSGRTLGTETKIGFKTYNQRVNNIVNMVMMGVMFGGIMFLSLKQQKDDKNKKEEDEPKEAFNPYREAKRTGKTIDEVKAEEAKRQEKLAKKRSKKKDAEEEKYVNVDPAEILNNVYKVKKPKALREREASVKKSAVEAKAARRTAAKKTKKK